MLDTIFQGGGMCPPLPMPAGAHVTDLAVYTVEVATHVPILTADIAPIPCLSREPSLMAFAVKATTQVDLRVATAVVQKRDPTRLK